MRTVSTSGTSWETWRRRDRHLDSASIDCLGPLSRAPLPLKGLPHLQPSKIYSLSRFTSPSRIRLTINREVTTVVSESARKQFAYTLSDLDYKSAFIWCMV